MGGENFNSKDNLDLYLLRYVTKNVALARFFKNCVSQLSQCMSGCDHLST